MKYSLFALLSLVILTGTIEAQQAPITPETPVTTEILHQWLHSKDLRMVAWAADFARRTHDAETIAEMPALLEHLGISPMINGDGYPMAQRQAITIMLDTLIQENAKVPISTISALVKTFPCQAAILISRLPLAESRSTLEGWTFGTTGGWEERELARIASMLLAKEPDPNFVGRVVSESEEELKILIVSGNGFGGGSGGGTCGDGFVNRPAADWPPLFSYDLAENPPEKDAILIVDLDGDQIASRRFDESKGWGSCFGVLPLNATTRHLLIAHWFGVPAKDMPWQPVKQSNIVWKSQADYEQQLGTLVESQREILQSTISTLHNKGFLTEGQPVSPPRLVVTIECAIKPCPLTDLQ